MSGIEYVKFKILFVLYVERPSESESSDVRHK